MDKEILKKYYEVFTIAWQFLKSHIGAIENTDKWWDKIMGEANAVGQQYKGTEQEYIANKLLVAGLLELQRKAKR